MISYVAAFLLFFFLISIFFLLESCIIIKGLLFYLWERGAFRESGVAATLLEARRSQGNQIVRYRLFVLHRFVWRTAPCARAWDGECFLAADAKKCDSHAVNIRNWASFFCLLLYMENRIRARSLPVFEGGSRSIRHLLSMGSAKKVPASFGLAWRASSTNQTCSPSELDRASCRCVAHPGRGGTT